MSSVYDQDQRPLFTGKWKLFKTLLVSSVAANTLNLTLWFQFKSAARHTLIYLPPALSVITLHASITNCGCVLITLGYVHHSLLQMFHKHNLLGRLSVAFLV